MAEQNAHSRAPGGSSAGPGTLVAVGLGSNLGDRAGHLATGVGGLSELLRDVRCSRVRETEPVGLSGEQGAFLNMCCVGRTGLAPGELLTRLLGIEARAGRDRARPERGPGPRTLDLDLLLYGDEVVDEQGVRVPHPRMRRRAFVLVPLAEIAGSWRDPETGRTISELAQAVDASGVEPYRGELPGELEEVIVE
jgi:2-amino-4-hydroxy-6-hydroxymethyldihydropteridine diphosphokinase